MLESFTDYLLRWWLRSGRPRWSWFRRSVFERGHSKIQLPAVQSIQDIESVLKQVTWTADGPLHLYDCISYPETTWAMKKDDCDGFSCLAAALILSCLPEAGPVLLTAGVRPVRNSHTVCAFRWEGGISFFDNSSLRGDCTTYEDVVGLISQNSNRLVCWDIRDPSSLKLVQFHAGSDPTA